MERMPSISFKIMTFMFKISDFFCDSQKKILGFNIKKGDVVIDYGCGPARYTRMLSEIVGEKGKVYCVDVHELAIKKVIKTIKKFKLKNALPVLIGNYSCSLRSGMADKILALDMFHMVKKPMPFLKELYRLLKKDGILIIEDGHQPRKATKEHILKSNLFKIVEENRYHLKCRKSK